MAVFSWLATARNALSLSCVEAAESERDSEARRASSAVGLLVLAFVLGVLALAALSAALDGKGGTGELVLGILASLSYFAGSVLLLRSFWTQLRNAFSGDTWQVLRLARFSKAPKNIRKSMRRILRSARSVRDAEACSRGLVDQHELQDLVFSAAKQAVLSAKLNASVRELRDSFDASDRESVRLAEERIAEISRYLGEVEERLDTSASSAASISAALTAPEVQRQLEQEQSEAIAAIRRRHEQARARLSETVDVAPPPAEQAIAFEEKVSALSKGFREVGEITNAVSRGPALPDDGLDETKPSPASATESPSMARATMGLMGRASKSVAKRGAGKLRQLMDKNG